MQGNNCQYITVNICHFVCAHKWCVVDVEAVVCLNCIKTAEVNHIKIAGGCLKKDALAREEIESIILEKTGKSDILILRVGCCQVRQQAG